MPLQKETSQDALAVKTTGPIVGGPVICDCKLLLLGVLFRRKAALRRLTQSVGRDQMDRGIQAILLRDGRPGRVAKSPPERPPVASTWPGELVYQSNRPTATVQRLDDKLLQILQCLPSQSDSRRHGRGC